MLKIYSFLVVITLNYCYWMVQGSNILMLAPSLSTSHSLWYEKFATVLAENGHKVHLLSEHDMKVKHENISLVYMKVNSFVQDWEKIVDSTPDFLTGVVKSSRPLGVLGLTTDPTFFQCEDFLKTDSFQNFMKNYKSILKIDLIIADIFCVCFYGLVPIFGNPPLIVATPFSDALSLNMVLQDNPSYVPYRFSEFATRMSFSERIYNTYLTVIYHVLWKYYSYKGFDDLAKKYFGDNTPAINDIVSDRMKLLLIGDYDYVIHGAKPLPPMIIPVAGLHIDPPKPLPKNIKDFLDKADQGAIIFSMGSTFKSILMSPKVRNMFLDVFKTIPQKVIWKLELEDTTGIPPNVMITNWLPQSDVLAHPNVKCFISHGGTHGTQEAVFRGVAIIGIPLFGDQIPNLRKIEERGAAIILDYLTLNENTLSKALNQIFNNPSYQENMKELSTLVQDKPQTPKQAALFWVEYVIRHSNSSVNYLRSSSMDLAWYEILLLDIIGLFALIIIFICKLISKIISIVKSILFKQSSKRKEKGN